jgi:hypothetical protein
VHELQISRGYLLRYKKFGGPIAAREEARVPRKERVDYTSCVVPSRSLRNA